MFDIEKKTYEKIKKIQQNNPKLFCWILGGIVGWGLTFISFLIHFITYY